MYWGEWWGRVNAFFLSGVKSRFKESGIKWPHIFGFCLNIVRADISPTQTLSLKVTFLYHGCTWSYRRPRRCHPWFAMLEAQKQNAMVERTLDWMTCCQDGLHIVLPHRPPQRDACLRTWQLFPLTMRDFRKARCKLQCLF